MNRRKLLSLTLGTFLVSIGGGLAGIGMSTSSYLKTLTGFTSCMIGYRTIQLGISPSKQWSNYFTTIKQNKRSYAVKYSLISIGMIIFSYGFFLGMGAGLSPELTSVEIANMIYAGIIIVAGLVTCHKGLNGVVI